MELRFDWLLLIVLSFLTFSNIHSLQSSGSTSTGSYTKIFSTNENHWVSTNDSVEIKIGDRISHIENSTVIINCPFAGVPYPRVTWFLNGNVIDHVKFKNIDITEPKGVSVLKIHKLDAAHVGHYTCLVFNTYHKQQSTAFVRKIEPHQSTIFSKRLVKTISVDETSASIDIGTNVTVYDYTTLEIRCDVRAQLPFTVLWSHNGKDLNVPAGENENSIMIKSIKAEQAGVYKCKIVNENGKYQDEQVSKIDVIKKVLPVIFKESDYVKYVRGSGNAMFAIGSTATVREGFNVKIACPFESVPKGKLLWQRRGLTLLLPDHQIHVDLNRLVISDIQMQHSGMYTCVVENSLGRSYASSYVQVIPAGSGPPKIKMGSRSKTVEILSAQKSPRVHIGEHVRIIQGLPLKIQCDVSGLPKPKTTWFLNRKPLVMDESVIQTTNMLLIFNFQQKHVGDYKCFAQNAAGKARAFTEVRMIVPKAPQIQRSSSEYKIAEANGGIEIMIGDHLKTSGGRNITIKCPFTGYPILQLLWKRGEEMLTTSDGKFRIDSYSKALMVIDANEWDSGKYACFASNSAGVSTAYSNINIIAKGSPVITSHDSVKTVFDDSPFVSIQVGTNLTTTTGKALRIYCPSSGAEQTMYEWTIDGEHLRYDTRISLANGNELIIDDLQMFDEGIYKCRAFTQYGYDTMVSKITVVDKQSGGQGEAGKVVRKSDVTVMKYQSVVLSCSLRGGGRPKLQWLKDGQVIGPSNKYNPRGEELVLSYVDETMEGDYRCVATTPVGETRTITKVNVVDFKQVRIHRSLRRVRVLDASKEVVVVIGNTVEALRGSTVRLQCPNTASPRAEIVWLHNNKPITENEKFVIDASSNDLIMPKMSKEYSGAYKCRAIQNDFKSEAVSVIAMLEKKLPVIKESSKHIETNPLRSDIVQIMIGDSLSVNLEKQLQIDCEGEALPTAHVSWKFNNSPITNLPHVGLRGNSLFIDNVQWQHAGNFQCYLINSEGFDTATTKVKVVGRFSPHNYQPIPRTLTELSDTRNTLSAPIGTNVTTLSTNNIRMECPVSEYGTVEVAWFKGDVPLNLPVYDGSITINNVDSKNTGVYTCISDDPSKTLFGSVGLKVVAPLSELLATPHHQTVDYTDSILVKEIRVDVGTQVTLLVRNVIVFRCPVKQSDLTVAWLKNGKFISNEKETLYSTGTLEEQTSFNVSCRVKSLLGSQTVTSAVNVVVPVLPRIQAEVHQDVTSTHSRSEVIVGGVVHLLDGSHVDVRCPVQGFPKPKVKWLFKGLPLDDISSKAVYLKRGGEILTMSFVEKHNEGVYTCEASNGLGDAVTADINVKVYVPRKPRIVSAQQGASGILSGPVLAPALQPNDILTNEFVTADVGDDYQILHGSSLKLNCRADGEPKPTLEWKKDGKDIAHRMDIEWIDIDTNNVNEAEGFYTCTALNEFGAVTQSTTVNVIVPSKPSIQRDPSTQNKTQVIMGMQGASKVEVYIGDDLKTVSGTRVYIRCPAIGIPRPTITYLKDGVVPFNETENSVKTSIDVTGTLELSGATGPQTNGVYTCLARNQAGSEQMNTTVTFYDPLPPQFINSNEEAKFEYNSTTKKGVLKMNIGQNKTSYPGIKVRVNCNVMGFPFPVVLWRVNGRVMANAGGLAGLGGNGTTLMHILPHDAAQAVFMCVATNMAGSARVTSYVDIVASLPPRILSSGHTTLFIHGTTMRTNATIGQGVSALEGSHVVIACPAVGEPKPTLRWALNGSAEGWLELNSVMEGDSLFINNLTKHHKGVYSCHVQNVYGSVTESSKLTVFEMEAPVIDSTNQTFISQPGVTVVNLRVGGQVYVMQRSRVSIDCPVTGSPKPQVKWYKNMFEELESYLYETPRNTLTLTSVTIQDGALYTCEANNIAGGVEVNTKLIVGYSPTMIEVPAEISPIVSTLPNIEVAVPIGVTMAYVRSSSTVSFTCDHTAHPAANVRWMKNGMPVDARYLLDKPHIFKVEQVTVADNGIFSCEAENQFGRTKGSTKLYIMTPPKIKSILDAKVLTSVPVIEPEFFTGGQVTVVKGTTFSLVCLATGKPKPKVRWLRNNASFVVEERIMITVDRKLRISDAQAKDSGMYMCVASNRVGERLSAVKIIVAEPPKVIIAQDYRLGEQGRSSAVVIGDNKLVVPIGSHLRLTCAVSGSPLPRITWLKDHEVVTQGLLQVSPTQLDVQVDFSSSNPVGSYVCMAANMLGEATSFVDVSMGVAPQITRETTEKQISNEDDVVIVMGTKHAAVRLGANVKFVCKATGLPKAKVIWKLLNPLDGTHVLLQTGTEDTLSLWAMERTDAGIYSCHAKNAVGSDEAVVAISIVDPAKIVFLSGDGEEPGVASVSGGISEIHVIEGERSRLVCDAVGYPLPVLKFRRDVISTWSHPDLLATNFTMNQSASFKNLTSVTLSKQSFVFNNMRKPGVRSAMVISNVNLEHSSVYKCSAKNAAGEENQNVSLVVHPKPKAPYTGVWVLSEFGKCSGPCGRANFGVQKRSARCLTYHGKSADNKQCDPSVKLELKRECETMDCSTRWFAKPWTQCTAICGDGGKETRKVFCTYTRSKKRIGPRNCPAKSKPPTRRKCNRFPCDPKKCVDAFQHCGKLQRVGFCRIEAYKTLCCQSCVKDRRS